MGLDLTLLPYWQENFAHTVLPLIEHSELFDALRALPATPVAPGFNCHFGSTSDDQYRCYGPCTEDAYGDPLCYVTVHQLLQFKNHPGALNGSINRGAWAYLTYLEPQCRVALYWH
jgi:hypothetical protein